MQFRLLLALSLLLLAGLSWLADARALPRITPAQAPAFDGQAVVLSGWASDIHANGDGQRMLLRRDGHGVEVSAQVAVVRAGDWVEATGRLARFNGRLQMIAERLDVTQSPAPATPDWDALAAHPTAFVGEPIALDGTAMDRHLVHGDHRIPLGEGTWPTGPQQVTGVLQYAPACLCHRLESLDAWTP